MLNLDKKIITVMVSLLLLQCGNSNFTDYEKKSKEIVGSDQYSKVYSSLVDSLDTWVQNKLRLVEAETIYPYKLDSLLCFDKKGTRLITCRHLYVNIPDATSDDIQYIYGEKIFDKWYFFKGASIVIPREMADVGNVSIPLSYAQLHKVAIKEVFSGYLDPFGTINEEWFRQHFENVGVCFECKTREDFQKNIVAGSAAIWSTRDTTQPIKRLEKTKIVLP